MTHDHGRGPMQGRNNWRGARGLTFFDNILSPARGLAPAGPALPSLEQCPSAVLCIDMGRRCPGRLQDGAGRGRGQWRDGAVVYLFGNQQRTGPGAVDGGGAAMTHGACQSCQSYAVSCPAAGSGSQIC